LILVIGQINKSSDPYRLHSNVIDLSKNGFSAKMMFHGSPFRGSGGFELMQTLEDSLSPWHWVTLCWNSILWKYL